MASPAERFAANLRKLRAEADLTQEVLGLRAEVHLSQISMMESAERLPRTDTLIRLAGALGVGVADLVEGIRWTPTENRPDSFVFEGREGEGDAVQET